MAATRPDIELQPTVNVKTTKALQTGCVHIEQMKLARQQRFGKKCESLAGMQRSLFEEDVDADIAEISAHLDRLLPQTGDEEKTTTRPVRKALPSHLPRVEKVIPADEERCPECNEFLRFIRNEVSEKMEYIPAQVVVNRYIRPQYSCPCAYSALFDHGLASKSDQRFASIRSTGNLTFSTAF